MYTHNELTDFTLLTQGILSFCFFISAFFVAANDYAGFNSIFSSFLFGIFTGVSHYGISYNPSRTFYGAILGASVILVFISFQNAIFWGQYSSCTAMTASFSPSMSPSSVPSVSPSAIPSAIPSASPSLISTNSPSATPSPSPYYTTSPTSSFSPTISFSPTTYQTLVPSTVTLSPSLAPLAQLSIELIQNRQLYGVECVNTGAMKALCVFSVFLMLSYIFFITILIRFKEAILGIVTNNGLYSAVLRSEDADNL